MGRANSKQQLDQIQTATNVHPNDSFEDAVLRLAAQFRHSRMLLRESRRIPGLHPRLRPSGGDELGYQAQISCRWESVVSRRSFGALLSLSHL